MVSDGVLEYLFLSILLLETLSTRTRRSQLHEYFDLTNFHMLMCINLFPVVYSVT